MTNRIEEFTGEATYDPYDLWSSASLGRLKLKWTEGAPSARFLLPFVGIAEIACPVSLRRVLKIKKHSFPHVVAMRLLSSDSDCATSHIQFFRETQVGGGWGLPFDWYSKHRVYRAGTPFVTNTPYVMEYLVEAIVEGGPASELALDLFGETWKFLLSLRIREKTSNGIAVSYSPESESRTVINANSYAALAYALHAVFGAEGLRDYARERALAIARWVIERQRSDGSWLYYCGGNDSDNFIDCFHTCFIVKNLLKVARWLRVDFSEPVSRGWSYINDSFFDIDRGLCRPFAKKSFYRPFRWDLYDQAEFLGLLIDFNEMPRARQFLGRVAQTFSSSNERWYCRVDNFGRKWGPDFLRWGIAPFLFQCSRIVGGRHVRHSWGR